MTQARNLLMCFIKFHGGMLLFTKDFNVSFTNNTAEQAVSMMEIKQKLSGCLRSKQGVQTSSLQEAILSRQE